MTVDIAESERLFHKDNHNWVFNGDCRSMWELPDECVQMVVTSPPFWGLRKYSGEQELIWGPSNCDHQWQPDTTKHDNLRFRGEHSIVGNERNRDIHPIDGWKDCEHEWDNPTTAIQGNNSMVRGQGEIDSGNFAIPKFKDTDMRQHREVVGNFCSLCGAWKGSYGLEPTPEMYIEHTIEILREIRRVLRPDGVVFWNIGDSYWGGGQGGNTWGGAKEIIGVEDYGHTAKGRHSTLKPKDLCLIPFRVAIACQEAGWWVRSVIIWSKQNPMPESVTNRPTESHEYILMLTKSGKSQYWTHRDGGGTREKPKADYRWVKVASTVRGLKTKGNQELGGQEQHHGQDIDPNRSIIIEEVAIEPSDWKKMIKCPDCEATGKVSVHLGLDVWQEQQCPTCNGKKQKQLWKRINLWRGHDYYWDADAVREAYTEPINRWGGDTLKRDTKKTAAFKDEILHLSPSSAFRVGNPIRPDPNGRNIRSVWEFPTQPYPEAHFAVFPEKLPELCIKAATPEVGCCSKCGSPWERVTTIVGKQVTEAMKIAGCKTDGTYDGQDLADYAEVKAQSPSDTKRRILENMSQVKEYSWQPTCKCNPSWREDKVYNTVPSIVLDPFAGAGTTLWRAKKLNRKAIGYEISTDYCRLILERNRQMALELNVKKSVADKS